MSNHKKQAAQNNKRKFDHKAAQVEAPASPVIQRQAKKQQTNNKSNKIDVDDQQLVSIGGKKAPAIQPKTTQQQQQQPKQKPVQQPKQATPSPTATKPQVQQNQKDQKPQQKQQGKKQPVPVVESESSSEEEEEQDEDPFPEDEDDEDYVPGEGEDDVNPFSPDFFAHLFGEGEENGEGEDYSAMCEQWMQRLGAEGDQMGSEGEMDMDLFNRLTGEGEMDYETMMQMMGEGEFGEGEFGHEGFFDYSDDDEDDEDDEANRSENDDLDELISLQAPAKKAETKKGKKEATKPKGKAIKNDEEDDGDDDDDDDIQAEFNFHDPDNTQDWHAVKRFMTNLIDKKDFNASEFADLITKQANVGTTIKCPDAGEEPLAFITALSLNEHKDKQSIKQVKDYILNNAGNEKNKKQIQQLFTTANVGLLLSDRLVNLPMEVVPPLYNELIKDMEFAKKELKQQKNLDQAQKQHWDFKYYILISQASESGAATPGGKKKGGEKPDAAAAVGNVWYTRFEDEFFSKHAQMIKKVPTSQNRAWLETGKLPVSNIIMVLPAAALTQVRDHLSTVIGMGGEEHYM